jgi:purine-binding chemotaxis protein CheW
LADRLDEENLTEEDYQKGRLLTFFIGSGTFGIEMAYITEIVGMQDITEVPEMPDYIKGIINLRGKIIPVMDVRMRFGKEPREYDDRTCFIVVDFNGVSIGLIVDSVSEVLTIPDDDISEVPSVRNLQGNRYVKNIGKIGSEVVLILDCERLLNEDEIENLSRIL